MLLNYNSVLIQKKYRTLFHEFTTEIRYTEFRIKKNTEFIEITVYGIPQNLTLENSAEVKSLPHNIPYSAEFQKVTSENTQTTSTIPTFLTTKKITYFIICKQISHEACVRKLASYLR
jgi:hypothetical protein